MNQNNENKLSRKAGEPLTPNQKDHIITTKERVDEICTMVMQEVVKFPKEERFLILGRVVNSLIDRTYKPVIVNYLEAKGKGEI